MARLNVFQNIPSMHIVDISFITNTSRNFHLININLPGSISFNTVLMLHSQIHTSASVTYSLGLYSLNGSTLSLANSASQSFNTNANGLYWISLSTSATQDITPGNWWLGFISKISSNSSWGNYVAFNAGIGLHSVYGGPFFRGFYSTSTNAFPASIATSDLSKEGSIADFLLANFPYIVISA